MNTWVCILIFSYGARITTFDMQSEDAAVLAAKEITSIHDARITCINQFDGKVLWFSKGKQVEKP